MGNKWELYDRLIEGIPAELVVESAVHAKWWLVKTNKTVGISMYFEQGESGHRSLPDNVSGMNLKELAGYVKSWNFYEATLAVAAMNAYYNTPERIEPLNPSFSMDAFDEHLEEIRGKRVAVIGHFPFLDKIAGVAKLSILEKKPSAGDYPDSACEYILPEQDYVFITGTSLANKTLPRLLELSRGAKIILTGPSVPLAPLFFEYGVTELAGTIAQNHDELWEAVGRGEERGIFRHGARMLQIRAV
jgi:uncharacterized protein (DUF4213/DUF364 family)